MKQLSVLILVLAMGGHGNCTRSPFPENRFHDDNMCGVPDLTLKEPEPNKEFTCPYVKPESRKKIDQHWPWLGSVTNSETHDKFLGVVIAQDTVVTDIAILDNMNSIDTIQFSLSSEEAIPIGEIRSGINDDMFTSFAANYSLQEESLVFLVLRDRIPDNVFRPICIPPQRYVEKMVKPSSCSGDMFNTITKASLGQYGFIRTEEHLFDEHSCSLSLLESSHCTDYFNLKFQGEDALKPDSKYKKRTIKDSRDHYTCHVGAIKAASNCKLTEAEDEANCRNTKKDQCLGFFSKGGKDSRISEAQELNRRCAEKTTDEYTSCIVEEFGVMNEASDRPFKGINCLHDFIEMPTCAIKKKIPGLMPLGNYWASDPCAVLFLHARHPLTEKAKKFCRKKNVKKNCYQKLKDGLKKCRKREKNKYYKNDKPFHTYWSLSMINRVQVFSESIVKESQCEKCSEGPNICSTEQPNSHLTNRQDFLFWFDSCRDKWFFLGTKSPTSLNRNIPQTCQQPKVYENMEGVSKLMRDAVKGKIKLIDLYPKPVIVVLGPTGVGKSTTGNSFISGNAKNVNCFHAGSGTSSKTKVTAWRVGKWLGVGQCVTIVDTPGTDDTSGELQDYENVKQLTEFLKTDLKQIDVFLVMFKATDNRFVTSMRSAIKVFKSIFGETFWENVATEFTYWGFAESEMKERYKKLCHEDFKSKECTVGFNSEPASFDSGEQNLDSDAMGNYDLDGVSSNSDLYSDFDENPADSGEYNLDSDAMGINDLDGVSSDTDLFSDFDQNENVTSNDASQIGNNMEELTCKLMMSSPESAINSLFFGGQNISSNDWNKLENEIITEEEDFIRNECQIKFASKLTDSMYEKADFVSRKIKKSKWNKEYETNVEIPSLFIHPVWDVNDNRQCERFKRETSKLLEIANEMEPFVCSAKCQAPKSFFAGKPLILDHLEETGPVYANFEQKSFKLYCTIWNGVSYSALRDEDVTWFRGWQAVEYKNDDRFNQVITIGPRNNSSFVNLELTELRKKDRGLYDCTYPEIKGRETLFFSSAAQVDGDNVRTKKTEFTCRLSIDKSDIIPELIEWYFAEEINGFGRYSTSLNKVSDQFAVSQLYMDFEKDITAKFEGQFACKTDEFSNMVDLLVNENAKWSGWNQWSSCDKTCQPENGKHGVHFRSRSCIDPRNNGSLCKDLEGEAVVYEACNVKCCPENGDWSDFTEWGACLDEDNNPKTCSKEQEPSGVQTRKRFCYPPSCGGSHCTGPDIEERECNSFADSPCPINGNWGDWGDWGECKEEPSSECAGTQIRKRVCDNPKPQYKGHKCTGAATDKMFCEPVCPVDCRCGNFTNWGQCDKNCGVCGEEEFCNDGTQSRERHCSPQQNGGRNCETVYGKLIDHQICNIPHCPVNGIASTWTVWSACDSTKGRQERTRICKPPKFKGTPCDMAIKEIQSCPVDCECTGQAWSQWSSCSLTCGEGIREKTRVCKAHKNNGRACSDKDATKEFSTKIHEKCQNARRCPKILEGRWGDWTDWGKCSVKCGGGSKSRSRKCEFLGKTVTKAGEEPFDEDYDIEVPCTGSGVDILEAKGVNRCEPQSCEVSTLFYLMDTTGSFSGTDQNTALSLGSNLLIELKKDGVEVPNFRIVTINDPKTTVMNNIVEQSLFTTKLKSLYTGSRESYGNGNWPEKSMDGILKALNKANNGAVICLFTDAASHDLHFEAKILQKKEEKDAHIFIFLTPDYPLYAGEGNGYAEPVQGMKSYRVYQRISNRHTYIMSKTEPSTASIIMHKALKSSQMDCLTYDGPFKWKDSPNECQFPFVHGGKEHNNCTTLNKSQPWCATIVKKEKNGDHVPSKKGGENWWGYCGNCKGSVDKRCKKSGHTVLKDSWRAIKGGSVSGKKYDDSKLSSGWYKFDVPGSNNAIPSFKSGEEPTENCEIIGSHSQIELPFSGRLTEHNEEDKDFRFCFDANCNEFKMIDVLWCPPEVHTQHPFHIYKLKPTSSGMGYCVEIM